MSRACWQWSSLALYHLMWWSRSRFQPVLDLVHEEQTKRGEIGIEQTQYRLDLVNSKSFVGKVLLRIKWKFELRHEAIVKNFDHRYIRINRTRPVGVTGREGCGWWGGLPKWCERLMHHRSNSPLPPLNLSMLHTFIGSIPGRCAVNTGDIFPVECHKRHLFCGGSFYHLFGISLVCFVCLLIFLLHYKAIDKWQNDQLFLPSWKDVVSILPFLIDSGL